jgi:hypothetical protein
MKQVIYKEVIIIDNQEYTVTSCDYSNSIDELINDNVLEDSSQDIVAYIVDDIVNAQ